MSMIEIIKKRRNDGEKQDQEEKNDEIEVDGDLYPLFAFVSDTHINAHQYHLPQRAEDIMDAFRRSLELLNPLGDHIKIIHGGDVFNSYSVSPSVIIQTSKIISNVGKEMYALRGNHDGSWMKGSKKDTALNLLDEMNEKLKYVESKVINTALGKEGDLYRAQFIFQSYVGRKTMEKLWELKDELSEKDEFTFNILVIHDIVEGTTPFGANIDRNELKTFIQECDIDMILAGHLHTTVIDEELNLLNPGSIECLDIDQADQERGFFLIGADETSGKLIHQWIPVSTRNFEDIDIDLGFIDDRDIHERILQKIQLTDIESGSVVRFTIKGTTETHLPRIDKRIFVRQFPDMLKIMVNNKIQFASSRVEISDVLDPQDAIKTALKDLGLEEGQIDGVSEAMLEISVEASERNEGWRENIRKTIKEMIK